VRAAAIGDARVIERSSTQRPNSITNKMVLVLTRNWCKVSSGEIQTPVGPVR